MTNEEREDAIRFFNEVAEKEVNNAKYSRLAIEALEEKTGLCKDCKWWKDSDGAFRRGIGAESKCPINCKKVYEGTGYCFMFEPQESEEVSE